jgi:hypothetical protein
MSNVQRQLANAGFRLAARLLDMFLRKEGGSAWYNLSDYSDTFKRNGDYRIGLQNYVTKLVGERIRGRSISKRAAFDIADKIPYPVQSNAPFIVEHLDPWQGAFPYGWATDAAWAVGTGWYGHKEAHLAIEPVNKGRTNVPTAARFIRIEFTAEMIQADSFGFPEGFWRERIPDYAAGRWLERHDHYPVQHREH